MSYKKRALCTLLFSCICFTLLTCKPLTDKPKLNHDMFVIAVLSEPKRLNPLFVSDSISHHISSLIFRGLTRLKKDMTFEGDLAKHWEIKNGGTEVIFYLRNDVFWHDMKPFTAEDVVFTVRLLTSQETTSPYSQRFSNIVEVKTIDSKTVYIRYKKPYGSLLESWTIGILPKHVFEGMDINDREIEETLIGTGPFKLVKWIHGQFIKLSANDSFYGEKPVYNSLLIRIIPDETTQLMEFKNGGVDAFSATINQSKTLGNDKNLNIYKLGGNRWVFWGFNLRDDIFRNPKFRQAMSHALDKDTMMKTVYYEIARLSNGPYPSDAWYYNREAPFYDFDRQKAINLLRDVGISNTKKPFSFEIHTNYENKENTRIAQMIQDNLKNIGIDLRIKTYDWQTFRHKIIEEGAFQSVLLSRMYLFDPDISQLWHSREAKKGGWNFINYKNKEVDKLLEMGAETIEKSMRQKIYQKVHYILAKEQACVFLFDVQEVVIAQKNIIPPVEIGFSLFDNLHKWSKSIGH